MCTERKLNTNLSLSMSTSDTKPQATDRKEKSLLGAADRLLFDGGGLVVTETTSMGLTPPRHSRKQQFNSSGSRRHMSYLGGGGLNEKNNSKQCETQSEQLKETTDIT